MSEKVGLPSGYELAWRYVFPMMLGLWYYVACTAMVTMKWWCPRSPPSLAAGFSSRLRSGISQKDHHNKKCPLGRSRNCHRHTMRHVCILMDDLTVAVSAPSQKVWQMMRTASVPQWTTTTARLIPILVNASDHEILPWPEVAFTGALYAHVVCVTVVSVQVAAHV